MHEHVEEIYTKDGKSLIELIQDWIDENNLFLNLQFENKQVKYFYR